MKKITQEEFINQANLKHNNLYDYSLVEYKNNYAKIKIICRDHGVFEQVAKNHKMGQGCPKCNGVRIIDTDQFIQDAKKIHGDTYDYSLVKYKNNITKIKIICKTHGAFEQIPSNHVNNHGCPKCANNIKFTNKQFIEKAKKVHGDKYDYSLVEYNNSGNKVKIVCPEHGLFEQLASSHLQGYNCEKCSGCYLKNTNDFVIEAKKVHGDTYDYSLVEYKGNKSLVKIICPKHDIFEQTPNNHLKGQSCLQCYHESKLLTQEEFIQKCKEVHGDTYDYSKSIYKHNSIHVIITCKKHGDFIQRPFNHLYLKNGCPICQSSKGEKRIKKYLQNKKLNHKHQFKFNDCKYKRCLPFDFAVFHNNQLILIEHQGKQHYEPVYFGGNREPKKLFLETQKRDQIKKDYCLNNGYQLIEIPYTCKDVREILDQYFIT